MKSRAAALLLSGAIGLVAAGCASATPTLRGQSPDYGHSTWGAGECPPSGNCHTGHCHSGAGCNLPFHPVHRNFHTYSKPEGLMYPAENTAPALYQYPYYTLRGPTDFFMK